MLLSLPPPSAPVAHSSPRRSVYLLLIASMASGTEPGGISVTSPLEMPHVLLDSRMFGSRGAALHTPAPCGGAWVRWPCPSPPGAAPACPLRARLRLQVLGRLFVTHLHPSVPESDPPSICRITCCTWERVYEGAFSKGVSELCCLCYVLSRGCWRGWKGHSIQGHSGCRAQSLSLCVGSRVQNPSAPWEKNLGVTWAWMVGTSCCFCSDCDPLGHPAMAKGDLWSHL